MLAGDTYALAFKNLHFGNVEASDLVPEDWYSCVSNAIFVFFLQ